MINQGLPEYWCGYQSGVERDKSPSPYAVTSSAYFAWISGRIEGLAVPLPL